MSNYSHYLDCAIEVIISEKLKNILIKFDRYPIKTPE